jgi:hypothetical protein
MLDGGSFSPSRLRPRQSISAIRAVRSGPRPEGCPMAAIEARYVPSCDNMLLSHWDQLHGPRGLDHTAGHSSGVDKRHRGYAPVRWLLRRHVERPAQEEPEPPVGAGPGPPMGRRCAQGTSRKGNENELIFEHPSTQVLTLYFRSRRRQTRLRASARRRRRTPTV